MKISVITVAFNAARTISHTIESFLRQNYFRKSLLIIDGGSTDETVALARFYTSDQITIFSEPDLGIYDAMNKGLRRFDGDAVGFLNADDAFHDSDALTALAEGLSRADIAYGDLRIVKDLNTKEVIRSWRANAFKRRALRFGWVPPHPTFYVRRNVCEAVGLFDLKYKIAADYDYMLRALTREDSRVSYVPRWLVDFQAGGISTRNLRSIVTSNLESHDSRRRWIGATALDPALLIKPLSKMLQYFA